MASNIQRVDSSNHHAPVPSGGTVRAVVTYTCHDQGETLTASRGTDGFDVRIAPPSLPAVAGWGASSTTFSLTLTRTTAPSGATCRVWFSLTPAGSYRFADYEVT